MCFRSCMGVSVCMCFQPPCLSVRSSATMCSLRCPDSTDGPGPSSMLSASPLVQSAQMQALRLSSTPLRGLTSSPLSRGQTPQDTRGQLTRLDSDLSMMSMNSYLSGNAVAGKQGAALPQITHLLVSETGHIVMASTAKSAMQVRVRFTSIQCLVL